MHTIEIPPFPQKADATVSKELLSILDSQRHSHQNGYCYPPDRMFSHKPPSCSPPRDLKERQIASPCSCASCSASRPSSSRLSTPASREVGKQQLGWPRRVRAKSLGRLKLAISHDEGQVSKINNNGETRQRTARQPSLGLTKPAKIGAPRGPMNEIADLGVTLSSASFSQSYLPCTMYHSSLFSINIIPYPLRTQTPIPVPRLAINQPQEIKPSLKNKGSEKFEKQ